MKIFMLPLIAVVVFYLLMILVACAAQNKMVYFPDNIVTLNPDNLGMEYEDLTLELDTGDTLSAWFVPHQGDGEPLATVLICHGNGGNISHRLELLQILSRDGFDCLIFDYRGYGLSTGKPGEKNTYADARRAWEYLTKERGVASDEIVILGRSLGGAIAAQLAAEVDPVILVLDSTFTSLDDVGAYHYPWLPVRLLSRINYDTLEYGKKTGCAILVMHSRTDRVVPYQFGSALYEGLPEPKHFFELTGGHNDAYMVMNTAYSGAISDFLKTQTTAEK